MLTTQRGLLVVVGAVVWVGLMASYFRVGPFSGAAKPHPTAALVTSESFAVPSQPVAASEAAPTVAVRQTRKRPPPPPPKASDSSKQPRYRKRPTATAGAAAPPEAAAPASAALAVAAASEPYSPTALHVDDGRVPTVGDDPFHALAPPPTREHTQLPPAPTPSQPTGANPYRSPWLADLDTGVVAGPLSTDAPGDASYLKLAVAQERFIRDKQTDVRGQGPYAATLWDGIHKHDWLLRGFRHAMDELDQPVNLWNPGRYLDLAQVQGLNLTLVQRVSAAQGGDAVLVHAELCDILTHVQELQRWPVRFVLVGFGDMNFGPLSDNLRETSAHNSLEARGQRCAPADPGTEERTHAGVLAVLDTVPNLVAWVVNQDIGVLHPKLHGVALGPGQPAACNTIVKNGYAGAEPVWPAVRRALHASAQFVARFHTLSPAAQRGGTRPYLLYINNSGWRHREPINNLVIRNFAEAARAAGSRKGLWIENGYNFSPTSATMHAMRDVLLQHKYALSPMGAGQDCFRHWEILFLGCIPVMTHSSLDHLFLDLPVLLVDDFAQLTPQFLLAQYPAIVAKRDRYNYAKLTEAWWRAMVVNMRKRPVVPVTPRHVLPALPPLPAAAAGAAK